MDARAETRTRQTARRRILSLVAHIVLIAASIGMLYPLLWMLSASFRPENEIFSTVSLWPSSISFESYIRGWKGLQVSFATFFANSFTIIESAAFAVL